MSGFNEYPKRLCHPQHSPAEWKTLGETKGLMAADTVMVKPERFPDVTVVNRDQEAQYAARGYRPNNVPDPVEYERAILDAQPSLVGGMQDYPRWMYHAMELPVLVKTADEEKKLGDEWAREPILATEDDEYDDTPVPAAAPAQRQPRVKQTRKPKAALVATKFVVEPPSAQ